MWLLPFFGGYIRALARCISSTRYIIFYCFFFVCTTLLHFVPQHSSRPKLDIEHIKPNWPSETINSIIRA